MTGEGHSDIFVTPISLPPHVTQHNDKHSECDPLHQYIITLSRVDLIVVVSLNIF